MFNNNKRVRILFFLVLLVYSITEITFFITEDVTGDEPEHLFYGVKLLHLNSYKRSCTTDDSKMPVSVLNAIPRVVQQLLHPGLKKNDNGWSDVENGRYITFLFSLLILVLVFRWSSNLYGPWAGLFSMVLTAFCPTFLAHAGLVTTDAYSGLILLLTLYSLWKYLTEGGTKNFIAFCIFLGMAQLVKQTFIHLYICLPLFVLLWLWLNKRPVSFKRGFLKIVILVIINLLIINIGFLFYKTGQPLHNYVFVSKLFNAVQQHSGYFGNVPLPLPAPFLLGMDTVKYFDELGGGYPDSSFGMVSILGYAEAGKSYWFYYIVSMLFKTPLPALLCFILAGIRIFSKSNRSFFVKNEFLLLFVFAYFLVVMSVFNHIQAGPRHILFLYLLLYILCGKIISVPFNPRMKFVISVGLTWLIISVYSYFNAYLSYTNELILDKKNAYKIVGNANLDFVQGYSKALEYIKQHPDVQFATPFPQKGKFLISVGWYEDNFSEHTYNWLRAYKPIDHVHHCFLLIEVK
ncbi:MAG: glycosyltransferase family 39 protein [Agriterribacter sp.]